MTYKCVKCKVSATAWEGARMLENEITKSHLCVKCYKKSQAKSTTEAPGHEVPYQQVAQPVSIFVYHIKSGMKPM